MTIFSEERCKEIMNQVGMPNSNSLKIALEQVANEVEQKTIKKVILMEKSKREKVICKPVLTPKIKQAIEWINSPEGKKALEDANDRAEKACKELREAMKVDPKTLHEPMTI